MNALDQVLGEFIDAWNAGRRPDVDGYLQRVPAAERDELAARIGTWLELAPTPEYGDAARAAIAREPVLLAARLPALRARSGLSVADLARRVVAAFGLKDEARAARHLTDLERGALAPQRLSNRLLDALRTILGEDLPPRAAAAAPAPAVAAGPPAPPPPSAAPARLALRTAAPEPLDELDRLFLGGPDG